LVGWSREDSTSFFADGWPGHGPSFPSSFAHTHTLSHTHTHICTCTCTHTQIHTHSSIPRPKSGIFYLLPFFFPPSFIPLPLVCLPERTCVHCLRRPARPFREPLTYAHTHHALEREQAMDTSFVKTTLALRILEKIVPSNPQEAQRRLEKVYRSTHQYDLFVWHLLSLLIRIHSYLFLFFSFPLSPYFSIQSLCGVVVRG
jgi:hypothetical protein